MRQAAVNVEESKKYFDRAGAALDEVKQSTERISRDLQEAVQKSTKVSWYDSLDDVNVGIKQEIDQAKSCLDQLLYALKAYDERMQDYVNKPAGAGLDV